MFSPIEVLKRLWGGQWPAFKNEEEIAELMTGLNNFWNRLTEHQEWSNPFRLLHVDVVASRDSLRRFVQTRCEELDGFYDGIHSGSEEFEMPHESTEAFNVLTEIRGFFAGTPSLLENPSALHNTTPKECRDLLKELHSMTRITNDLIQKIIRLNAAERRFTIELLRNQSKTLH